jgi:hypothetical protein
MNKRTKFFMSGVCAAVILGLAGCQSTNVDEKEDRATKKREWAEIRKQENIAAEKTAKELAAGYFKALRENNYALYVKGRTPEARAKITPKRFKQLIEMKKKVKWQLIGEPKFVGALDKGIFKVYLWIAKIQVEDKNKVTRKTTVLKHDFVYCMSLGKIDGKYIVRAFAPIM